MNSLVPPHQEGRIAIVTDVDAGCGGRGSVGRAWQSQGGRTARERSGGARTNGAETFSRRLRRNWYQARRAAFSIGVADGEVVWSWRSDAGAKLVKTLSRFASDGGNQAWSPGSNCIFEVAQRPAGLKAGAARHRLRRLPALTPSAHRSVGLCKRSAECRARAWRAR
jgi:hypothetical protein